MKLKVNGKEKQYNEELTIAELLAERDVKMPDMVSVELNGKIIPRNQYNEQRLNDGDEVEFLYFMGGGFYEFN